MVTSGGKTEGYREGADRGNKIHLQENGTTWKV